jgi:hypothetical protein
VRAGNAWRQTRRELSGVAGRRTSDRIEDTCGVVGRAATTGRVDGEIQEELKHPTDCWYVPVCWVWGDSKEDSKEGCFRPEGGGLAVEEGESEEEGGRSPEGSDFAAEEGCEEGGPNAEEGYEEVWDEVQEALSTMGHEEYDETVLCARSQASRPSSAASSQASVRS